jgi:hypothetical protein
MLSIENFHEQGERVPHDTIDLWQSFIQIASENQIRNFSANPIGVGLEVQPPQEEPLGEREVRDEQDDFQKQ